LDIQLDHHLDDPVATGDISCRSKAVRLISTVSLYTGRRIDLTAAAAIIDDKVPPDGWLAQLQLAASTSFNSVGAKCPIKVWNANSAK